MPISGYLFAVSFFLDTMTLKKACALQLETIQYLMSETIDSYLYA